MSFALLAFFVVVVVFRRPLLTAAVVAVGAARSAFYLIFPVALSVSLPTGSFGF